jgi:hypothetical protein
VCYYLLDGYIWEIDLRGGKVKMEKITKFDDKCIIVRIPVGIDKRKNLYEATRRCWRANLRKAKEADYVLGTINGEVLCVIKIKSCNYASSDLCEKEKMTCKEEFGVNINLCENKKRIVFEGKEVKDDKKYLGKKLSKEFIPGQMPVRYSY